MVQKICRPCRWGPSTLGILVCCSAISAYAKVVGGGECSEGGFSSNASNHCMTDSPSAKAAISNDDRSPYAAEGTGELHEGAAQETGKLHEARRTLAAGYQLLEKFGHGDLAAGFFTCRSPANSSVMLVGEQGLHFGEVRASDVLSVDIETGQLLPGYAGRPVSLGALRVAAAVYRMHPHIGAFLHSHPKDAMALAALEEPRLLMMTEPSFLFYERVAYLETDFFFEEDYASKIALAFKDKKFLLHIKNHAIMVAGKDVPQAFYRAYLFDQAAGLQLKAMATGQPLHETSPEESHEHRRSCEEWAGGFDGSLEWPGLLRRLAREGSDYAL